MNDEVKAGDPAPVETPKAPTPPPSNVVEAKFGDNPSAKFSDPIPKPAMFLPTSEMCVVYVEGMGSLLLFGDLSTLKGIFTPSDPDAMVDVTARGQAPDKPVPMSLRALRVIGISPYGTHESYWKEQEAAEAEYAMMERGPKPRRPQ